MAFFGVLTNLHKIRSRQLRDLKLLGVIAYIQFHRIWDFWSLKDIWDWKILSFYPSVDDAVIQ